MDYGDSNPGPLACHQQAARPPESIAAGHRPPRCTRVRSRPPLLRYFRVVLPARRRTLVAGARAPWLPAARAMLSLPRLWPDGDVTPPHSGERPVRRAPHAPCRDQGRPGRKLGGGCSRSDVCEFFTAVIDAVIWLSSRIPSLAEPSQQFVLDLVGWPGPWQQNHGPLIMRDATWRSGWE